ncbi:unnamed protein product [Clonostachys chloroleuca]|uniref:E3 ubiquitin-protein ligase listerin n=1 Tax=Clonostachys chloroleuca TaxID=1926264 RepID=A0AA35M651_9HYPO|nr:unnamed protein product [Clonostachys chloroleuca]
MKKSKGKTAGGFASGGPSAFGAFPGPGSGFGASGGPSSLSYLTEPPSLHAISDPNVVVSLKNVLKKDPTTKSKALEELVAYVQAHPFEKDGGVEDAVLDVWVQVYARTSIDNSRRVRELAHNLQLELMKSARKRMERQIPSVVGAWLSGLYDRDRVVARAANGSLSSFLTTPEKVVAFWRKCQAQILDFATSAIQETEDTLSDERSTTKEDSEAKYARVVTASLSLVLGLLQKVESADIERFRPQYDEYFSNDSVWKAITSSDASVRKTVCQLFFVCLDRKLPYSDETKARQAIVTGGLRTNQLGSALEYVRALTKLTQADPNIWVSSGEKKTPLTRLNAFIAKGSQGSIAKFWEFLDQLLSILPTSTLGLEGSSTLLTSLLSGVTNRDEPRTNTSFAWKCFIDTAKRLLQSLGGEDQLAFGKKHIFPLFEQFLFAVSEKPNSIPLGPNAMSIFVDAYIFLSKADPLLSSEFSQEWENYATRLSENISNSLPEVSKEFEVSQEKIGEEGRRWFGLVGLIYQKTHELNETDVDHTKAASEQVISQSISLLEKRSLKPFGAARIVDYALSTAPHLFNGEKWTEVSNLLLSVGGENINQVIESPASRYLFSWLRLLGSFASREQDFAQLWNTWLSAILGLPSGLANDSALASLLSHEKASELARRRKELQDAIVTRALASVTNESGAWDLLETAVTYSAVDDISYEIIAKKALGFLEQSKHTESALKALEILVKGRPQLFSENEELHTGLVAQLLRLSEIGQGQISGQASAIRQLLDGHSDGKLPVMSIIQANLDRAGPQALEIETVLQQAKNASSSHVEDLFPSTLVWTKELQRLFERPIDPSLSITSNVGASLALIQSETGEVLPGQLQRDRLGRSIPVRMALYLNSMLQESQIFSKLPEQFQAELLSLQCVTVQLVSDQITLMSENGPWASLKPRKATAEAEELISSFRSTLNSQFVPKSGEGVSATFVRLLDLLMSQAKSLTARGFYTSRVLYELVQSWVEAQTVTEIMEEKLLKADVLKASPDTVLVAGAILAGLGEAAQPFKGVNNLCNRLVSEISGAALGSENARISLTLLIICGQVYGQGDLPVANNRIVFAVRQLTSWLDEPLNVGASDSAQICRALDQLLPCMKDVYGSYWEKTIEFCITLWVAAGDYPLSEALPFIHSSLKLMKTLKTLPEPNDDLEDALKEFAEKASTGLVELLKLDRDINTQPLEVVDGMICREIEKLPIRLIPDLSEIYPLIASDSRDIQTAGFNILHRVIPSQQEQQSVNILLDKTDARLPDELLSLLLDAPTLEKYSDDTLSQFPPSLRTYLLAWKLVFDTFASSSFKIRTDFTEHLKVEGCSVPLFEFMFDVLGHSAAHAIKLDKVKIEDEHIRDYDIKIAEAEDGEKNMQWLLVHLFYLTLKYTPGLFRAWYLDCRSKQTKIAVEAWTTKYFSPLIIENVLEEVQNWAENQEAPGPDEQELLVKVSKPAREVTAGYEVDESQAAIVIKVPPSYPIDSVTVSSLSRVAVTERKWQGWIMTTQGVITFSNGNIIDGLQVFKRNIIGALKGQGECAICYSIISTDKRMPDKRCTTCKNLFHRTCLYKWFQSSNQNTCPLCRNPIDYLGADTAKRRQV